ncbi:MAG TPA: YhdP family protein [Spongiibacteraceae bacterium]
MLIWLNRTLWTLLVGAVVLLGIIVSLGQHYLPYVESHQQELVDAFNRRTGLQLSVGHISGQWRHLSPHFVIDDLRLRNPLNADEVVLQITHAELQLGIFRSINNGTIAISQLQGNGVRVQLDEIALGHWQLAGFSGPSSIKLDRVLDMLVAIYRADLSDSHIDLRFFRGGEAHLAGAALRLQRAGDFRRLNLQLAFADDGAPLQLAVESHGDPRDRSKFSARGYAAFTGVDLTPVLPMVKAFGFDLKHGRIDGAAWLDWRAGGAIEVRGKAAMAQLDLAGIGALALAPVKNIKAEFLIRDRGGRRQLWLPVLTGVWNGIDLNFPQLMFIADSAQPQSVQLALPELQLSPLLQALLADENLPRSLHEKLAELAPGGTLRNILFDVPLRPEQRELLRVRAQLENISIKPWQGGPGVDGASGYIDAGIQAGHLDLVSDNFGMTFPHVYHEPLHFDKVRGQIGWRVQDEHVLVNSGPIPVQSDAGRAIAQFALNLPLQHGGTPLMTLQVGLQDSGAQYRDRFIPYTLQPSLLNWLQRALSVGDIPLGGFIYRGSLLANDHANNTVQLFLQVRDAQLAYQPGWPPLHDVRAGVWVDDGALLVHCPRARIYDRIALANGIVELQHENDVSWLSVHVDASADNDDVLRLLRESPLREHIGATLDSWRWRGPTQSRVELGLALNGTRPLEVRVDSQLGPGTLNLVEQNLALEDVRGEMSYRSENGLQANALSAKWFGKSVAIKVASERDGAMKIDAQGRIAMLDLKQWLQQPLFDFTDGDAPFAATLSIANGASTLQVQSDLRGASVQLPPPYQKSAEQTLPLNVALNLNSERTLFATLGDWADLHLRWAPEKNNNRTPALHLDGGVVRLGQTGKTTFNSGQLIITGAVPAADFSAWRDVLHERGGAQQTDDDAAANALAVQIREIHFGSATFSGQTLRDLIVSGRRDSTSWAVQMRAEQIAGTLTLPDDKTQPWRAQLNYLRLPAPATIVNGDTAPSALDQIDPSQAFAVDLHIDHLWRGDEEFGWIDTQLRPIANGLRFEQIKGQLRAVTIEPRESQAASLSWTRREGIDSTEFAGKLAVDDIGTALQRWHYEPVVTSKHGYAEIQLQWPGRPDQFKFAQAGGAANLHIDDGRFLRASGSTTGALKVVGIFNFANFLRRLQLDFSDVFKDGVSFDQMQGAFSTRQGVLKTDDPIEIKSPSSRFRLAGQIDFNTDQTDMELVVTLPVASNLPWVAALAAGLPAAAGVYVASKIFENQFDKFASAAYQINGPWTDPQVKLRRVFDDQLPKRNEAPQKNAEPATATESSR